MSPLSPAPTQRRTPALSWVPLFRQSASTYEPLVTATDLPPTQRRMTFDSSASSASSSGGSPHSAGESPPMAFAGAELQRGVGGGEGASSAVRMSPALGRGDEGATFMQRQASGGAAQGPRKHLRRRSSSSVLIVGEGILDQQQPKSLTASTAKMERVPSLTSYMNPTLGKSKSPYPAHLTHRNSTFHKAAAFDILQRRRRVLSTLTRSFLLSLLLIGTLYSLRRVIISLPFVHHLVSHHSPSLIRNKAPTPLNLYDTLETVPYPLSSHPRTPNAAERHALPFAEYLSTRLGSHFSFPPSTSHPTHRQSSHLWLTTANNASVRVSTPHLVAFVAELDLRAENLAAGPGFGRGKGSKEDESTARRKVVVLCEDEGCEEYCRERKEWYCFGGFGGEGKEEKDRTERVKIQGAVEALESGRRVFLVDPDVYFKEDPVPYLGALQHYDMQIPDSWHSGRLNAGFAVLQPTQNLISLWRRLLTLSTLPPRERLLWSTTNLLLDPFGQARDHRSPSSTSGKLGRKFDEVDDAVVSGYGEREFESDWGGGLDVRVLGRRFRTQSGRLGRLVERHGGRVEGATAEGGESVAEGEGKKEGGEVEGLEEAVYHHCVCCGDMYSNDYIAGSLGFHHPSVAYPLLTSLSTNAKPTFPLVLKVPSLVGDPATLTHIMGLLLQLASDTGRAFVPPLKGTLLPADAEGEGRGQERYSWRLFPLSPWSHGSAPGLATVKEPSFVQHALSYLRSHPSPTSTRLNAELQDVLYLDLRNVESYQQAVNMLKRGFFKSTVVVMIEGVEQVRGKEGWGLRGEFGEERVGMCRLGEEEAAEDGHGRDGQCVEICRV